MKLPRCTSIAWMTCLLALHHLPTIHGFVGSSLRRSSAFLLTDRHLTTARQTTTKRWATTWDKLASEWASMNQDQDSSYPSATATLKPPVSESQPNEPALDAAATSATSYSPWSQSWASVPRKEKKDYYHYSDATTPNVPVSTTPFAASVFDNVQEEPVVVAAAVAPSLDTLAAEWAARNREVPTAATMTDIGVPSSLSLSTASDSPLVEEPLVEEPLVEEPTVSAPTPVAETKEEETVEAQEEETPSYNPDVNELEALAREWSLINTEATDGDSSSSYTIGSTVPPPPVPAVEEEVTPQTTTTAKVEEMAQPPPPVESSPAPATSMQDLATAWSTVNREQETAPGLEDPSSFASEAATSASTTPPIQKESSIPPVTTTSPPAPSSPFSMADMASAADLALEWASRNKDTPEIATPVAAAEPPSISERIASASKTMEAVKKPVIPTREDAPSAFYATTQTPQQPATQEVKPEPVAAQVVEATAQVQPKTEAKPTKAKAVAAPKAKKRPPPKKATSKAKAAMAAPPPPRVKPRLLTVEEKKKQSPVVTMRKKPNNSFRPVDRSKTVLNKFEVVRVPREEGSLPPVPPKTRPPVPKKAPPRGQGKSIGKKRGASKTATPTPPRSAEDKLLMKRRNFVLGTMAFGCAARKAALDLDKVSNSLSKFRMVSMTNPDPTLTGKVLSTTARQSVADWSSELHAFAGPPDKPEEYREQDVFTPNDDNPNNNRNGNIPDNESRNDYYSEFDAEGMPMI